MSGKLTVASGLSFDGSVSFGDLLTTASVLLAALTLYLSAAQNRAQTRRAAADSVRTAAADALATLQRYALLPQMISENAESLVVSVSRKVVPAAEDGSLSEPRDDLWQGLTTAWEASRAAQRAEGVEKAHVRLYGYRPDAYEGVALAISRLDSNSRRCFYKLRDDSQQVVLDYANATTEIFSAEVGNSLRSCLNDFNTSLTAGSETVLADVRARLETIISADDKHVTSRSWRPAE